MASLDEPSSSSTPSSTTDPGTTAHPSSTLTASNSKPARASLRIRPGTSTSTFQPSASPLRLSSLDGPYRLSEYLSSLVGSDVSNVDRIVHLPGSASTEGGEDEVGEVVDPDVWLYEHLLRLPIDLTPLVTSLLYSTSSPCTPESCPEMKAGDWIYMCAAHPVARGAKDCCAIDYILHSLDFAAGILNSTTFFPSRLSVSAKARPQLISLARRLSRIFAHAYYNHRETFESCEAETSLYRRFLLLSETYSLVEPKDLPIPSQRFLNSAPPSFPSLHSSTESPSALHRARSLAEEDDDFIPRDLGGRTRGGIRAVTEFKISEEDAEDDEVEKQEDESMRSTTTNFTAVLRPPAFKTPPTQSTPTFSESSAPSPHPEIKIDTPTPPSSIFLSRSYSASLSSPPPTSLSPPPPALAPRANSSSATTITASASLPSSPLGDRHASTSTTTLISPTNNRHSIRVRSKSSTSTSLSKTQPLSKSVSLRASTGVRKSLSPAARPMSLNVMDDAEFEERFGEGLGGMSGLKSVGRTGSKKLLATLAALAAAESEEEEENGTNGSAEAASEEGRDAGELELSAPSTVDSGRKLGGGSMRRKGSVRVKPSASGASLSNGGGGGVAALQGSFTEENQRLSRGGWREGREKAI